MPPRRRPAGSGVTLRLSGLTLDFVRAVWRIWERTYRRGSDLLSFRGFFYFGWKRLIYLPARTRRLRKSERGESGSYGFFLAVS